MRSPEANPVEERPDPQWGPSTADQRAPLGNLKPREKPQKERVGGNNRLDLDRLDLDRDRASEAP